MNKASGVASIFPSVKNGTASVTAGELEEVVKEIYGKAPYARTIYARATIYIVKATPQQ